MPLFLGFVSVVVLFRFHSSLLCSCILSLPSLLPVFDLCVYLNAFGFQRFFFSSSSHWLGLRFCVAARFFASGRRKGGYGGSGGSGGTGGG